MYKLASFLIFSLVGASTLHAQDAPVTGETRSYLSLDGQWDVLPIDGLKFDFPPPQAGWKKEKVPSEQSPSLLTPAGSYDGQIHMFLNAEKTDFLHKTGVAAWFKRDFTLDQFPTAGRVQLQFDGMSFKSEIWLNGKKIGGSLFGQLPIAYDVTDALSSTGSNQLVIGLTAREGVIDLTHQTFLAPTNGSPGGIWGHVQLESISNAHIDDIFVKTSVKNKLLTLDVTLVNASNQTKDVSVEALITDVKQNPETRLAPIDVSLAPRESKVVTLSKPWIAPELWSPTDPALYFAHVFLSENKVKTDSQSARFGFREFEIRGRDFYLNGQRVVLLRDSMLEWLPTPRAQLFQTMRSKAGHPYNSIRLHIGHDSPALLDLCDELGFMTMPESAWFTIDDKFPVAQRSIWLPGSTAYLKALIKANRNRPSVIMWNLTNESVWEKTGPDYMEVADAMIAAAREADPTRPFEGDAENDWDKRLPVTNIHYPEAAAENTLRAQFPNSGFVFPNDYYWLSKDQENLSRNAKFQWDRPLIFGEYFYPSGDPDKISSFMGDSVYDWEKWRYQRLDGRGQGPSDSNNFLNAQQGLTDAYRLQGAAGVNPWASNGAAMPQIAVRPVDFFPNAFSGETVTRKFAVLNDSGKNYNGMNLQCRLTVDGETVWDKMVPAQTGPGEDKVFNISIACPAVDRSIKAELDIHLVEQFGNTVSQISRYTEPFFILPKASLADVDAKKIFLFDTTGKTATALTGLGLTLKASSAITGNDLQDVKTLIIGEDSTATPFKDIIADFVRGGGSVVVLRQDDGAPLTAELPEADKAHVSTRSWKRTSDHPITREFDDAQLSYWRPDHVVSTRTLNKPTSGKYRILLDSGGLYGMKWSPLLEVPLGKGTFVLTSLDLIDRTSVEPVAAQLLANMIRYANSFAPAKDAPLRLLAGSNDPLRAALKASGVVFTEGVNGDGPVLVDATAQPTKDDLGRIKGFVTNGGRVWLHGFGRETIGKVADLLPFPPALEEIDPAIQEAALRSTDPLLDNLASYDFSWSRMDMETGDFFLWGGSRSTAKLGSLALKLPTLQSGQRLITPGLLVKIPDQKGTVLFDTLAWENALGAEADKVMRIVSALAENQGALVQLESDQVTYDYFPVDISKQANMGYYDKVADDGQGGWTDQGTNDMRFFLINHVGKTAGLESGADLEAQRFPSTVEMAKHKFWLLDPRATANHAIISLRGQDHGAKLPESAKDIPVHHKADVLWFLDAAGWAPANPEQEIARYVIHYADGTEGLFPIRFNHEIAEWWNPKPIPGAAVAWTGTNLVTAPVGIYATEWVNPHPEKEIATIDILGNLTPVQYVVLAITGGTSSGGSKAETSYGEWNLSNLASNQVPNQIKNNCLLRALPLAAPQPAKAGSAGAHFENGQRLTGSLALLPDSGGMGKGEPFAVKIKFTPDTPPVGAFGGLFEAMSYGHSGFRLMLNQQMKLVVEVFLNERPEGHTGFESQTPLEAGRSYAVELIFDGKYATLLINNHVDKLQTMPLPASFAGDFVVGTASGQNYSFNGTVENLALLGITLDSSTPK